MNTRTQTLRAFVAAVAIVMPAALPARPAMAAQPAVYTPPFTKLALEGYDPVT